MSFCSTKKFDGDIQMYKLYAMYVISHSHYTSNFADFQIKIFLIKKNMSKYYYLTIK